MKKYIFLILLVSILFKPAITYSQVDQKPNNVSVHDPSVIKVNKTYYVFGSHLAAAKSNDLINWIQISTAPTKGNKLVPNPTREFSEALKWAQTDTFWAPDIIKLNNKFYLYYCNCEGSSPRADIGIATSDKIEGPYHNQGMFLKSGMWDKASEDGTIYDATKHPNTVDPNLFFDHNSRLWMVYGSYSGGIFLLKMNSQTGKPEPGQGYGKKLLGGNHSRIEGPYIIYNPETEYYYLFLSYGGLSANGGYNIRVARSKKVTGPYYDNLGHNMINTHGSAKKFFDDKAIEPYEVKLLGNFQFYNKNKKAAGIGYVSPGHNSVYYDKEKDKYFIFFHTRFPGRGEYHELRVHQMFFNQQGWPVIAPHRYHGETIKKYSKADIVGQYAFINHGQKISSQIKNSSLIKLNSDGSITGSLNGSWQKTAQYGINLTIAGDNYNGILIKTWDSSLQKKVISFTAIAKSGNKAIWGSKLANN